MNFLSRKAAVATLCNAAAISTWAQKIGAEDARYTLRFSVPPAATSVLGMVAIRFAQSVKRRTKGEIEIEVYPNGQLGSEQQSIDGLTAGTVDFVLNASGFLQGLFPQWQVFDLPFLFKDLATAYRVFDGPIGTSILSDLESKGIVGFGYCGTGFREFETAKSITTLADMKGMRFRIVTSAVNAATFQALGAIPLAIEFSETTAAIMQHTIDGVDYGIDSFFSAKIADRLNYMAMSNHIFGTVPLIGSKRKIDSLPARLQNAIKDEGRGIIPFWRDLTARRITEDIQALKKGGLNITQIQYESFRKAVEPVYTMVQARLGRDLVDRVVRAANNA